MVKNQLHILFIIASLFLLVTDAFSYGGGLRRDEYVDTQKELFIENAKYFDDSKVLLPARFPFDLNHENKNTMIYCTNTSIKKDAKIEIEVIGKKTEDFSFDVPKSSTKGFSITDAIKNRMQYGIIRVMSETKNIYCEEKEEVIQTENIDEWVKENMLELSLQDEKDRESYIVFTPMNYWGNVKEANLIIYNLQNEEMEFEIKEYSTMGKLNATKKEKTKVKTSIPIKDFSSQTFHIAPMNLGYKYMAYIKVVTDLDKVFYIKSSNPISESYLFDAKGILTLSNISEAPVAFEYKIYDESQLKINGIEWVMPYAQRIIDVGTQVKGFANPVIKLRTHNKFYPKECNEIQGCGYTSRRDLIVANMNLSTIASPLKIEDNNSSYIGRELYLNYNDVLAENIEEIVVTNENDAQKINLFLFYENDLKKINKLDIAKNSALKLKLSDIGVNGKKGHLLFVADENISVFFRKINGVVGNYEYARVLKSKKKNDYKKHEDFDLALPSLNIECVEYCGVKDDDADGLCNFEEAYFDFNKDSEVTHDGHKDFEVYKDIAYLKEVKPSLFENEKAKKEGKTIEQMEDDLDLNFVESKMYNCIGSNMLISKTCQEDGIKFYINDLRFLNEMTGCLDYVSTDDIEDDVKKTLKEYINSISDVKDCSTCNFIALTPTDLETKKPDFIINITNNCETNSFYSNPLTINLCLCEARDKAQGIKGLLTREIGHLMCLGDTHLYDRRVDFANGLMKDDAMCLIKSDYEMYLKIISVINNLNTSDDKEDLFYKLRNEYVHSCCDGGKKLVYENKGEKFESECVNVNGLLDENGKCSTYNESFISDDDAIYNIEDEFEKSCEENKNRISNNKCGSCPDDEPYYKFEKNGDESFFACCENPDDKIYKIEDGDIICCHKGYAACGGICCKEGSCKDNQCIDEFGWKPFPKYQE